MYIYFICSLLRLKFPASYPFVQHFVLMVGPIFRYDCSCSHVFNLFQSSFMCSFATARSLFTLAPHSSISSRVQSRAQPYPNPSICSQRSNLRVEGFRPRVQEFISADPCSINLPMLFCLLLGVARPIIFQKCSCRQFVVSIQHEIDEHGTILQIKV